MTYNAVHEAYDDIADKFQARVAVLSCTTKKSLTYEQLRQASRRVAACLLPVVNPPHTCVGVLIDRDEHLLSVYVGVSRTGMSSMLPLPRWKDAELAGASRSEWTKSLKYSLSEGGVSIIITNREELRELEELSLAESIKIMFIEDILSGVALCEGKASNSVARAQLDEPILKLLSGGSTGSAKLYPITHRMVLSELDSYLHVMGSSSSCLGVSVLQQTSVVWPASCFGQFNIALAVKGAAVISLHKEGEKIGQDVIANGVKIIGGAPSQLALLLPFVGRGRFPVHESSLQFVFSWGASLPKELASDLVANVLPSSEGLIELLVATEYWLCLYSKGQGKGGQFEHVPSCRIDLIDPDDNGIGQLQITGPMVGGNGTIITSDLVQRMGSSYKFIGRKDFLTKIGGNWLDLRQIEEAVLELGPTAQPCIKEAAAVSFMGSIFLVLSVGGSGFKSVGKESIDSLTVSEDEESSQEYEYYDSSGWLESVRKCVSVKCPAAEVKIRIVTERLPVVAATGKLDRRLLISQLMATGEGGRIPENIFCVAKSRFTNEAVRQAKWTALFVLLTAVTPSSGWFKGPARRILAIPYMYLVWLHFPRNSLLPRSDSGRRNWMASFLSNFHDLVYRDFPLGKTGLLLLLLWLTSNRRTTRVATKIAQSWLLFGLFLAFRGGRALSWPFAFWTAIGAHFPSEAAPWVLSTRKWRRTVRDLVYLVKSLPDSVLGTTFCVSAVAAPEAEVPEVSGEGPTEDDPEETTIPVPRVAAPGVPQDVVLAAAEEDWWVNSPVQYISVGGTQNNACAAPAVFSTDNNSSSVEEYVIGMVGCTLLDLPSPITESTSLKGVSSLQVTELLQKIRLKVAGVSARDIMDSSTVGGLVSVVREKLAAASGEMHADAKILAKNTPKPLVKIQFSPGQVNRTCRWMIKSKKPFDMEKLAIAFQRLVNRHPLLRSELEDPKALHSFLYDAGIMVVSAQYIFSDRLSHRVLQFASRCLYGAWARLRIHPPAAKGVHAPYWEPTLTGTKKSAWDYDYLRRVIMQDRRDRENPWCTHQNPINGTVFQLNDSTEYLLLSVKHSIADGNSAFPLIDELAELYEQVGESGVLALSAPTTESYSTAELEKRFYDGITVNPHNPNRSALRTVMFYSPEVDQLGGGYYRHYLCIEPNVTGLLRKVARETFQMSFDSLFLSMLVAGLLRADKSNQVTLTLYCPLRDGPGEASIIGLLADWRDVTVNALPNGSVFDLCHTVADLIRNRRWEPTLSPAGPESVLINWLLFDGVPRLKDKSWEPFHLDQITTRWWSKTEKRDYDPIETPSSRLRSMTLDQYTANGEWWLRFDVATKLYPPGWMMDFSEAVNRTFCEIMNCPFSRLL